MRVIKVLRPKNTHCSEHSRITLRQKQGKFLCKRQTKGVEETRLDGKKANEIQSYADIHYSKRFMMPWRLFSISTVEKGKCQSFAGKILARILLNRVIQHLEKRLLPENKCGFRSEGGTADMIFAARQLQEKC